MYNIIPGSKSGTGISRRLIFENERGPRMPGITYLVPFLRRSREKKNIYANKAFPFDIVLSTAVYINLNSVLIPSIFLQNGSAALKGDHCGNSFASLGSPFFSLLVFSARAWTAGSPRRAGAGPRTASCCASSAPGDIGASAPTSPSSSR